MAKLILSLEGVLQREFVLDRARTSIGRRSDNDISIDNLAISGQHAVLLAGPLGHVYEDLNSTNGSSINGRAVQRHVLQHGDVIELGKYRLKYMDEAAQAGARLPAAVLRIQNGNQAGQEVALNKPLTTLGKPGVQVAVIARRAEGYVLSHVEGDYRPRVGDQWLTQGSHVLQDHDIIELAGIRMEFCLAA